MINNQAMFQISYGLYVLSAKEKDKDNGCIINTVTQVTDTPKRITIAANKQNYTHDMVQRTGRFNVSVLDQSVPFEIFQNFGFQSGKDVDKWKGIRLKRATNGIAYLEQYANAYLSGQVISSMDMGSHTLFIAEVEEADRLSSIPSTTYDYYQSHIKPAPPKETKKGWRCTVCGYIYEGEELPADFICPLCKHGAADFVRI